jgi:catechol 2,3-dioxygenase-like lactoylglutathione lyase family enzyme
MLSHTTLGVHDVQASLAFYRPVMDALGLTLKFENAQMAGWKHPETDRPLFVIIRPFDGNDPAPGNGAMIAFLAATRSQVDEVYQRAIAHGGSDEGAPGLRPHYHADYYGAYFRDPDGNKLCICCHEAADVVAQ